jgi:D-glycero-alpha-D-manno-heptose 1-phosphate guanylyltransferase
MTTLTEQAIVLAGGLGTRLRTEVPDRPKSMALIHGRPFLEYQLDFLIRQGIRRVVLSTGYLGEMVENHFGQSYKGLEILCRQEKKPLGTGGGILYAAQQLEGLCFILNGDSFFDISFRKMQELYQKSDADAVIALRYVDDAGRYGSVQTDAEGRILQFYEKEEKNLPGLINGGIYLIKTGWLQNLAPSDVFSVEKDIFGKNVHSARLFGISFEGYFIDIGIPEDYKRACNEFSKIPF